MELNCQLCSNSDSKSQSVLEMLNIVVLVNMQKANNYAVSRKYNIEKRLFRDQNTEPYQ